MTTMAFYLETTKTLTCSLSILSGSISYCHQEITLEMLNFSLSIKMPTVVFYVETT